MSAPGSLSAPPAALSPTGRSGRILVIEDDPDTGALLSDTLLDEGYEVRQAADGLEGLTLAESWIPDLILLDIMMPNVDGMEVCRRIRGTPALSRLPILFITAKDGLSDKIEGFRAGGNDYITKPFLIGELLARVEAHLRILSLQRDLSLSEERYRLLVENSPDGVLLLDPGLEIRFFNTRFLEIQPRPIPPDLLGKTLRDLFPVSDLFPEIDRLAMQVLQSGGKESREVQIAASNHRTIYFALFGLPLKLREDELAMVQIVIHDITQRRRMEEAMIQAEKIHSLGILTAGIAHEVNNPLTGISNAIQILRKGGLPGDRQAELCDLVLSNIGRIAKIVKDLRTFSRPHGATSELFGLVEAIRDTLALARYQAPPERITFDFHHPEETLYLYGDRNQFQQIMINLLLNSIQAIAHKGAITVTLAEEDGRAAITLDDTGCGIPANQLGQIFDPFFTTKRHWKGTGLGLAVSYRIIQLFKGTLTVQSTVDKGSRFIISLPLAQPPGRSPSPPTGSS